MGTKRKVVASADAELMTIGAALDEFIEEKVALNKSQSTIKNYEQSVRLFMEFHNMDSDTTLDTIGVGHFLKWGNKLKTLDVSISSINHYLRDCRAFFYWCMAEERGYMKEFKIRMLEAQEEQLKLFSDEEIEALLEKPRKPTAKNNNFTEWRNYVVVNWILATGNRCATIVEVKIGDINFNSREIVLRHTKNKKAQTIPLSSSLETVLKEYIRMFRKGVGKEGWLFPNVGEEQLTTNALRHSFQSYCAARGVESTNLHGLRHNFAKMWIRNNGDTFRLQKLLGHADLAMTRRYVKLFSEDLKDDFDKFNPLDNIKKNATRKKNVRFDID